MTAEAGKWADVGATWYLESNWTVPRDEVTEYARDRLSSPPPGRLET
jgi:hypothetical protein